MGLLEDLGNESNFPVTRRAWCSVCEMLKTLSDAERKALMSRLENKAITHMSLSIVLKNNGYEISDSTLGRHRRGVCQGVARK
jgi:hypothetical protein